MYSQRCPNCGQLITLKNDEVRAAVEETEASNFTHYDMPCPKCRRTVKIPLKTLKLKMPRNILPVEDASAAAPPTAASAAEAAAVESVPAEKTTAKKAAKKKAEDKAK